jgi:hypothetical protein
MDHPLFPHLNDDTDEGGEDPIAWINVTRLEGGGYVYAPQKFEPDALQDLQDLADRFGGGAYELIAKRANGTVRDRQRYRLPGASLPLTGDAPQPSPAPAFTPPAAGGGDRSELLAMMQMFMQANMQNTQLTMQMVTALLTSSKSDSQAMIAMMAKNSESNTAIMSQLFQSMQKSGGGDGGEALVRGLELGMDIAEGKQEKNKGDLAEIAESVATVVGAMPPPTNGASNAPKSPS